MTFDGADDTDDIELAELERRIAKFEAKPTEHESAGGASLETGLLWTIASLLGMFASAMLLLSEINYLRNPAGNLLCDVNPLVGCSTWFTAWQGTLIFDVPNALWGALFFAGMSGLGLVLLTGGRLHRSLWSLALVGISLGMIWVLWFGYQSYVVAGSICPYCVIVWIAVIPLFVHILARTLQAGHLGQSASSAGSALVRNRWIVVAVLYVTLVAVTIIAFWNSWALVF
ncbi:putative membrane protein [Trueperella bonasi]|uniref:Membrane protein n=1 Tax=Trueperella bonasi TaxID=312286 RepID=A0ABT9NE21_9ACTO|nr:vitamin K epoxide reductase family protein [Trueperella bonasi]MDP9805637.1 putative membrane protein [Trueperella bonasi]